MRNRLATLLCAGLCLGCAVSLDAPAAVWSVEGAMVVRRDKATTITTALPGDVTRLGARSDGGAWAVTKDGLWSLAEDGQLRQHVDLATRGLGGVTRLAVDAYDGSAWAVTDERLLLRFGVEGALASGTSLPAVASALAVGLDQSVWVVAGGELLHFSRDARWLGTRLLAADSVVEAFAIDGLRDRVWFTTSRGLFQMSVDDASAPATQLLRGEATVFALDALRGSALALVDGALVVIDASGSVKALGRQLEPGERVLALLHDATDGVFVLETNLATLRVASDARVLEQAPAGMIMIGATPLRVTPAITLLRPPGGGAVADPASEIVLGVGAWCNDATCEVPPSYLRRLRVEATLDGVALGDPQIASDGRTTFPSRRAMTPGENALSAMVTDMFGHVATLDRVRWTLLADSSRALGAAVEPDANAASPKATNKSPTVSLTSPANGSAFTAGSSIALTATAADADGSIAKVEFYRGGTLIGSAAASPYSYLWTNVAAGSYSLTAKAYDNRKATSTSTAVTITVVDNQPPNVGLTSPASGSFARAGSIVTLSASASDSDGAVARVDFLDGGAIVATVAVPPYDAAWHAAAPGIHRISARATDDKGGVAQSSPVDVVVGDAPVIVVTGPAACSMLDGPVDVVVAADAMSVGGTIASVEFFDNGVSLGSTFVAPWRATLANASAGSHAITAKATDDHGLTTLSRPSTFTVRAQNQPPGVALIAPAEGARFALGVPIDLAATATDADGTIAAVEFRIGGAAGTLLGRAAASPYAAQWTNAAAGSYSIVAVAYDDRNAATTSAPAHIVVNPNALPTVTISAPATNARFTAPARVTVTATASDSDGSIAKVEFFAGTIPIGAATLAPYGVTWTNVAAGSYSLTAKATDNAGGVTTSVPVPITVAINTPPTIALTSPAAGNQYFAPQTLLLAANAADSDGSIASVDFYANGALVGHVESSPYRVAWDGVGGGNYTITAKATDNAGGTATSAPVNVVVNAAPSLSLDGTLVGATIDDDNVLVRGVVSAPDNSAVTINGVVTHVDDLGRFQANDVPLEPGDNTITAVITTQDGQTASQSITLKSSGPGGFVVSASPTEGLESLEVTFTIENPRNTAFKEILLDLDNDGVPNMILTPGQFIDGKATIGATYPIGTWLAVVKALDDQNRVIYSTSKSIVVLMPQLLQGSLRAIYDGMLTRLRAGNIAGAMTAFTGSAYDRYNDIFTQLAPSLSTIVDQIGELQEITFNLDMAEMIVVRSTPDGPVSFMVYLIRSEDGIWRIDGM